MSFGTKLRAWSIRLGLEEERLLFFLLIKEHPRLAVVKSGVV
jgi:hypothetical protein